MGGLFAASDATAPTGSGLSADFEESRAAHADSPTSDHPDHYAGFYRALAALREDFHRIGRFDDANAKLDEMCKLLVLKVLDSRHPAPDGSSRLSLSYLSALAAKEQGSPEHLAAALHSVFDELAARYPDELEALGPRSGLNMSRDDDAFARALVPLLESLPADANNGSRWVFDGINEAFGHFIQDSFRNRKEDAQYMTPPEVVSAAVDIAFVDILREVGPDGRSAPLLVADPTCGVGSFLAAAYRRAAHVELSDGPLSERIELFGQDKVGRMARLAAVNLRIFADARATVREGNSIIPSTGLDDIAGKVDLILTNPPFGASFTAAEILSIAKPGHFPVLRDLAAADMLPRVVDSEYLLLDREIALLKPGGRLLMVVPDHVVSGNGFSEAFRLALLRYADLVGVLDLPTETFAQAGTRTKTSIVYLRRPRSKDDKYRPRHVFMAVAEDLGFRVTSRKGASVKTIVGGNDLASIVELYRTFTSRRRPAGPIASLSQSPSVSAVSPDALLNNRWAASFYKAERLSALKEIDRLPKVEFEGVPLPDLVTVDPDGGERVLADANNKCISVLHIRDDGCVDLKAVESYRPITPCARCRAGDVLISKINPRITRICVVPETPWDLGCSSEFAVLRSRSPEVSPWALALLLRSETVQSQLRTLTSGTSSSHNRIKDQDLRAVRIPVPRLGTPTAARLASLAAHYESAARAQYDSLSRISDCFASAGALLTGESGIRMTGAS